METSIDTSFSHWLLTDSISWVRVFPCLFFLHFFLSSSFYFVCNASFSLLPLCYRSFLVPLSVLRFLSINCPFSHKFFNFFRFLFLLLLQSMCGVEEEVTHKLSVAAYSVDERQTVRRTINVWVRERLQMFFSAKIRWARTLRASNDSQPTTEQREKTAHDT